jgi:hypothetical protein
VHFQLCPDRLELALQRRLLRSKEIVDLRARGASDSWGFPLLTQPFVGPVETPHKARQPQALQNAALIREVKILSGKRCATALSHLAHLLVKYCVE